MRVLVAYASRHRATAEIAERIGARLRAPAAVPREEIGVDVRPAGDVGAVARYDAAVIGSAVYLGRWLDDARRLVEQHAETLRSIPVWIFSSGPIGDPPMPQAASATTADVVAAVAPRGQRVFAGRLDRSDLSLVERAVTKAVKAPSGDYRDWAAVDAWADEIAEALAARPHPVG